MIMIKARTTKSIIKNWPPNGLGKVATLSVQHTAALIQVTLPCHACSGKNSLHTVVSKKPSHTIWVLDQHAWSHDGSPGQCNDINRMIRKSQCLLNLRRKVEGVWELQMYIRLSKRIQCTVTQHHLWWLANYESYRFTGMEWCAMRSVWLAYLFLEPHE